jgi:hypothetical protein
MTYYENLTLLQNATSKTTYAMNSDTDRPGMTSAVSSRSTISPSRSSIRTQESSYLPL